MALYKHNVGLLSALRQRSPDIFLNAANYAPTCRLCMRELDGESIVEVGPTWARVLARHHGAEELARFDLGTREWDHEDLSRATRGHEWFKPSLVEK